MDPNDPAVVEQEIDQTRHLLDRYIYYRYVLNRSSEEAYHDVVDDPAVQNFLPQIMGRFTRLGHINGVEVDDAFAVRREMQLIGFHDDHIRGICFGFTGDGVEVASALVAIFPLHNFRLANGDVIYGGEGGHLRAAHLVDLRVLEDQVWSQRNLALFRSINEDNVVRLVFGIGNHPRQYEFDGLYRVLNFNVVESNQNLVLEFKLRRAEWVE